MNMVPMNRAEARQGLIAKSLPTPPSTRQGSDALSKRLRSPARSQLNENRDRMLARRARTPTPAKASCKPKQKSTLLPKAVEVKMDRLSDAVEEPISPKHQCRTKPMLPALDADSDKCSATGMRSNFGKLPSCPNACETDITTCQDKEGLECKVPTVRMSMYCSNGDEALLQHTINMHAVVLQTKGVPARYAAAEALAALGPRAWSARLALEQALLRDTSVHVRKSAAFALGELGDKDAEASLRQALQHDEDKFVCQRVSQALDTLFPCL